jgi:butyryl-CoA dehydrogenase
MAGFSLGERPRARVRRWYDSPASWSRFRRGLLRILERTGMRIELNEEQILLRDTVRRFAEGVVAPRAKEIDASGEFPLEFFRQAGEIGLAGVYVPEEFGGAGMDMIAYCVAIEEISKVCASSGVILSVNNSFVCDPLLRYGNDHQKREFLAPLAAGAKLGCFALTEPGAGSDAAALRTTARRDGDDYVLDGDKVFITNGTHADLAIVFASVDPEKKHRGIAAFVVPTDAPGFQRGHHEYKLGVQASGTTQLFFEGVRVPAANRLGAEGDGFKIAMGTLDGGRVGISAQAVGIAQGAFEAALAYAKERRQFGKPIADFQAIQFYLADMAIELDAARLLTYRAAWAKDNRKRYSLEAAQAKLFSSEMAQRVTNKALQIHGGYGYTREYDVERFFRDARITEIYEGTSEIQKLVISDWILGEV